jgi:FG-GAP-like repeat/FG-GAP repeat
MTAAFKSEKRDVGAFSGMIPLAKISPTSTQRPGDRMAMDKKIRIWARLAVVCARSAATALGRRPSREKLMRLLRVTIPNLLIAASILALAFPASITGASFIGFVVAPTVTVGNRPRAVAVGDFNGDGLMDLAVISQSTSIGILLGCTAGTPNCANGYLPPVNYALPNTAKTPTGVVAADFNADGKLDLIIADAASNDIALLQGGGDGSFVAVKCGTHPTCAAGVDPVGIVTGNFTGKPNEVDVAVINAVSNSVSVFPGNGISFGAAVNYSVGNTPTAIATADLNGDGYPDLIVTNGGDGTVTVLLGNGHGAFTAKSTTATGSLPLSVATGDFNGDGHMDVAVVNSGSATLSILLGKGDGTFSSVSTIVAGAVPQFVAVGDMNGDKKADLIVADGAGDNVAILLGNRDGTFQPPSFYVSNARGDFVTVADLNADGRLDVVVANRSDTPGGLTVIFGNGDGTLASATNYPAGPGSQSIVLAHFSCNANWDFAVTNSASNTVAIGRGNGNGTFQTASMLTTDAEPVSIASADFDHSGGPDIAVANSASSDVSIFLANSTCTGFAPAVNYSLGAGATPVAIAAADFNGDGYTDLAVANLGAETISILLNNGDGSFTLGPTVSLGFAPNFVAVGDFNNDKKMDLAVTSQFSNSVAVFLGNGDGTFTLKSTNCTGPVPCKAVSSSVVVADFNGDGKMDLAVTAYDDSSVSILLGKGDGTFGKAVNYPVGTTPLFVATAPIQGNAGQQDLLVANAGQDSISVLLNNQNRTGTFKSSTAHRYSAGSGPSSIGIADLNGDGKLDMVIANQGGSDVTVLIQQ